MADPNEGVDVGDRPDPLRGKVALVTGAARGQGRSHAVRLAQAGADVIAIDVCRQIPTVRYPMSTPADLAETVRAVEALDRRIEAARVDIRDSAALRSAVDVAAERLGGVDIVVANAAIAPGGGQGDEDPVRLFRDMLDVNLTGTWNTVKAAAPRMIAQNRGGSVVLISSTQGLTGRNGRGDAGLDGYCASKHAVVGLMRTFAHWLAPHRIRVNTVHPTGVDTPMVNSEVLREYYADRQAMESMRNLMPVDLMEPLDVSHAVAWLASDAARYVTGITLPVDAGFAVR